ncbi:gamma-aminobutyric acid type B receptor subunit 2-like isoform X2 [Tachypleus tridentatus]|uniref:gamma-aminobutyric acid type B receptor subunit 2-like isoform X2 n=1 Tax=Tachypleus tridentatus TaxID=6853 RepID=UPI003FD1E3FD
MLAKVLLKDRSSCSILCIKFCLTLNILSAAKRTELKIGGFFPVSTNLTEGATGRGVIPAVKIALDHINANPFILPGYKLTVQWNDTKCDPAVGMKNFLDMLSRKSHKVIVLFGAVCTAVTDPIAKAAEFFQLVQLTYADTHPMYTVENYPNFFRVVPSEAAFNPARVALLQHFNWTRVGTLYQNSPRYALPHSKLLTDLETAKIEIAVQHGFVDELQSAIRKLKEKDVRIILGNFDQSWAGQIFCEAYRVGLYGTMYQWIIVGMYDEHWWRNDNKHITCDQSQLQEALEGYIATDVLPLSTEDKTTVSGLIPIEYEAQYDRARRGSYSRFHGYAYDGIWAIALAIQKVGDMLISEESSRGFETFKYKDPTWARMFRKAFKKTSFLGVTGLVSFTGNERRGFILLKQFQGGTEVKIGEYDSIANTLDLSKGRSISWRGDTDPPMDRTLIIIERTRISVAVYSILVTFSILGILLASVFLVVNVRYRNQRNIKMSSPYLNNLIIVGCMLTYTSVVLLGLDSRLTSEKNFPYICAGRAWVLMSGFTLAFGSIFSKTWRVHAVFTNIKLNKIAIKDYKLFMVVGVLMMIDVAILTTWQIIDPFYRKTSLGPAMAFGCFLAWETRQVNIPALNDSKYVGMSVYNVVIMCIIGAAISFVLRDKQDAAFVIISVFIIFCSTTTLCLVFVPKIVELRRNPDPGDKRARATLKPFKSSRRDSDDKVHTKIKDLEAQNFRQKQILSEKAIELQALILELKDSEEPVRVIQHPITSIPENSSSSADSTYEGLLQVVKPCVIREDGPSSQTQHYRKEENHYSSGYSQGIRSTCLKDAKRKHFHQKIDSHFIITSSTPDIRKISFKNSDSTTILEMLPLSVTQKINNAIKQVDSKSTTVKERNSSFKCLLTKDDNLPTESGIISYTRSTKNFHQRIMVNGVSPSCDEGLEQLNAETFQKEKGYSSRYKTKHRQRSKSLVTLRPLTATNVEPSSGPCVSVIHNERNDRDQMSPLFPCFNVANEEQFSRKFTTRGTTVPLYSSFPSVKCDIVEYL